MGEILVRCANPHTYLWFHLDMQIANDHLRPEFRNDGREDAMNRLLHRGEPWDGLTSVGNKIVTRVLGIRGGFLGLSRSVLGLKVAPVYFDLEVRSEKDWRRVLPEVVKIIREETGDPRATVKLHPKGSTLEGHWHASLIKELFG